MKTSTIILFLFGDFGLAFLCIALSSNLNKPSIDTHWFKAGETYRFSGIEMLEDSLYPVIEMVYDEKGNAELRTKQHTETVSPEWHMIGNIHSIQFDENQDLLIWPDQQKGFDWFIAYFDKSGKIDVLPALESKAFKEAQLKLVYDCPHMKSENPVAANMTSSHLTVTCKTSCCASPKLKHINTDRVLGETGKSLHYILFQARTAKFL